MYIRKLQNSLHLEQAQKPFPREVSQSNLMLFPALLPSEKRECPFLVTFLELLATLFLVPFRLRKNSETGEYSLHTSNFRRAIAFLLNAYISIHNLFWAVFSVVNYADDKYDLSSAFYTVSLLSSIGGVSALQYIIWRREEDILRYVEMTSVVAPTSTIRKQKILAATLTMMYIVGPCMQGYYYNIGGVDSSSFGHFIKALPKWFGLDDEQLGLGLIEDYPEILEKIGFAIYCGSYPVFNMPIIAMLMLVLTTRTAILNRFSPLISNCAGNIGEVLKVYGSLKELSGMVKSLFGPFIFFFYICVLSFVALFPLLILSSFGVVSAIMGTHMFVAGMAVGLAADFQSKIDECLLASTTSHHWEEEYPIKDRLKLLALGQDISRDPIGISCYFFTVTKSFISSTFGLVVTYSIIVFQMMEKNGREKNF